MERYKKPLTVEQQFENLKKDILVVLRDKLVEVDGFPFDFNTNVLHDTITDEVDSLSSGITRMESLEWIDFCGNEKFIDKGIVDGSSIDRTLVTTAFECIRQKLFDDEQLIMDMQVYDLTKRKRDRFVSLIDERIGKYEHSEGKDNSRQIWVTVDFDLTIKDFKPPVFVEAQIIDLHDSVKILTSNTNINQNAIVLEHITVGKPFRVYLMEKDNDVDILEFFKYTPSIKENDYSLDVKDYVDGKVRKQFSDKKRFIWVLNQMANKLTGKSMESKD